MNQASIEAKQATVQRKPQLPKPLPPIQRYGLAVLSVSVALAAALLLAHFNFRGVEVPLFLFALTLAAWYGGAGAAALAFLLSCISFAYFFVQPIYSIYISNSDLPYLLYCFRSIRIAGYLV
jgi:K+-sensing histidine kinase KdpD